MNAHDKISRLIDKLEAIPAMDFAGRAKGFHDLRAAIEDDRKRRGEPVYQVNMRGNGWEDCSLDRYESAGRAMEQDAQKGLKRWDRRVLWAAPAEPVSICDCERSHNGLGMGIRECDCPADQPQPAEPVNQPTNAQIREVFLANGFTIKPGHDDLKPYVYEAARELLRRYGASEWEDFPK